MMSRMSIILLTLILWSGAPPLWVWAQSTLENPQPLSVQSGLGVISGWACNAARVEIEMTVLIMVYYILYSFLVSIEFNICHGHPPNFF